MVKTIDEGNVKEKLIFIDIALEIKQDLKKESIHYSF